MPSAPELTVHDETILNTEDEAETIPATDSMIERVRQVPTAVQRDRAAGPVYLWRSSSRR